MSAILSERLWRSVPKDGDGCWVWRDSVDTHGYGRFMLGGKTFLAHRAAYELTFGSIPQGHHIDHLCRNRRCCNPAHLETVSPRVNTLRGEGVTAQHARKTHCVHGHPFDEANTYHWNGRRKCRACYRANAKKRNAACQLAKLNGSARL